MANWFTKIFTTKRKYEGASRGKRLGRWQTTANDANASLSNDLPTLRNRARDLRRNNPYASRAVIAIANNMVGKGIKTQIRGVSENSPIEKLWNDWVNSPMFDYEKRMNFYQMQYLVAQSLVESGEVLVKIIVDKARSFPLCFQVLEGDYIDTTLTNFAYENGNFIVQGIEFNGVGERVAYHLYKRHPGSVVADPKSSYQSSRVPASEVLHVYRQERSGQARGVTWFAPVMVRLKDLDDYEDAQLVRQKIAACFTVFVKDISADMESSTECEVGDKVEPGIIEQLPNGKEVQFANPPTVDNYKEYISTNLRAIASGLGVNYEMLTGDMSEVNFSSGRMGHLEFQRNVDTWRNHIVYPQFLDPVVGQFKAIAELMGVDLKGLSFMHVPPRREMIDPTKEIPAITKAIRSGLTTLSEEVMAQGRDPEEHFKQYAKDNKTLDDLGIVLDSDPRKVNESGKTQAGEFDE